MITIIGLGNPGEKYKNTRHNIGFMALDNFVRENKLSNFKNSNKFNSQIIEEVLNNKKLILAKPQTFMNNSGKPVKKIVSHFKIKPSNIWVIHDDIDLPLGKIKISKSRGSAGHKGVESIIKELKTKNFIRFRIGIKPKILKIPTEKFVLQKFKENESVIKEITTIINFSINNSVENGMNKFNK